MYNEMRKAGVKISEVGVAASEKTEVGNNGKLVVFWVQKTAIGYVNMKFL